MRRSCLYHAGCPDGFGAAWAVRHRWGERGQYTPVTHDDPFDAGSHAGALVAFVDIAPSNGALRVLAESAAKVIVLDHHLSARERFAADPELGAEMAARGHLVRFDLDHSGAVLAWQHFCPEEPAPEILRYVEDQDLWNWKLPHSEEVNAAIASYPRRFDVWDVLAKRSADELAAEGEPIRRANRMEVERVLHNAHAVFLGERRVEAVNATQNRSAVGHELAKRAAHGSPYGCAYRVIGERVYATLYSIGDFDVSAIAAEYGGGGHCNAAGFNVPLDRWMREFL
jgi:oligoribonuclease NrnB/cAMP/cGMP phosphodiesterase (DHH superfamily)